MSQPGADFPNPYQAPASAGLPPQLPVSASNLALVKLVKDFRSQIHALGGFWIFIGGLVGVLSLIAADVIAGDMEGEVGLIVMGIFLAISAAWLTLGVFTCLKHIWAVYVGLALSYLSLIGNVINLNICGLVILAAVIIQAHRVISWSKQLTRMGIPLTTKPGQMQVEFRPPPGMN